MNLMKMMDSRKKMLARKKLYENYGIVVSDMEPDLKVKMTASDFCVFLMVTDEPNFYLKKDELAFMELVDMVRRVN